jgi:DNA helicase HerA-like ATPase
VGAVNILTIEGDRVRLVYNPGKESVEVGDNIVILDRVDKRGVLALVYEISAPELPGILLEIARREVSSRAPEVHEPPGYAGAKRAVEGLKLAVARIVMEVRLVDGDLVFERWRGYAPSRDAEFLRVSPSDVVRALRERRLGARRGEAAAGSLFEHPVAVGSDAEGAPFEVSAYDLQGLNLIVGLKGTGKSHLAKAMLLGLAGHGVGCLVFDVNDEYSRLDLGRDGRPKPELEGLFAKLRPGETLKFPLSDIEPEVLVNVMEALGLRDASLAEFIEVLEGSGRNALSLKTLKERVARSVSSSHVRGAILRRLRRLEDTGLIDDSLPWGTLASVLSQLNEGKTLVVNLKGLTKLAMRTTVQVLLSNLLSLLEARKLEPVFLFAEEAHLYIDRADIEDLVTRMRHLGLWQFYVTNTPTSLPELLVRQADNLFCFYLSLPDDVKYVAPASGLEPDVLQRLVAALPPRCFLAVGQATEGYPVILRSRELDVQAAGETRYRLLKP